MPLSLHFSSLFSNTLENIVFKSFNMVKGNSYKYGKNIFPKLPKFKILYKEIYKYIKKYNNF